MRLAAAVASSFAVAAAAVCIASPARAGMIFSSGDPLGDSAMYNEYYTVPGETLRLVPYAKVSVPVGQLWTVGGFGAITGKPDAAQTATQYTYKIVTHIGDDASRTVVASGTVGTTQTPYAGVTINGGGAAFLTQGDASAPIMLFGGQDYWISFAAIMPDFYNQWVAETFGANAVNGPATTDPYYDDYDSRFPPERWYPTGGGVSPALRLYGATTPEPATLSLLCGVGLITLRRRR